MATNGGVLIPFDVIDIILDILHNDRDKASLSACSQVCHQFLHPCRRHLFSHLIYYAMLHEGEFSPLSTFLQDSHDIRPYIRQLSLRGNILDVSELLIILNLLPSLQDLTLRRVSPYYRDDTLSKVLCYPRHLQTLNLEKVTECYEDLAPSVLGLDAGSVISMFPDVGKIILKNVDFNPDDIMVDRQCVRDFRANVERSLRSLGFETRINPEAISIWGPAFPATSLRVVSQLCLPSLDIVLDIRPQDNIPNPVLSSHHDAFSNADFLENVGFIGYVYPYRRLAGIIWESFEELVFVLPRKAIKQVGLHIHYPEVSLKAMTSTLRTLSQKDWGRIQESLDEMEGLTRMMVFFSYHWEDIDLDQVDQLIELDQKWQEVIKEKLPGLHQRGLIRFASSIQHHIHRFKR